MDESELGNDVQKINELTVIASESYDSFAKALQSELAENVTDRPIKVTPELFKGKEVKDLQGKTLIIDDNTASAIHLDLIQNGYIDRNGQLTEKYHKDKEKGQLVIADEVKDAKEDIIKIIDSVYDPSSYKITNQRKDNVTLKVNEDKLNMAEFKKLWNSINSKSVYVVHFDTDELVKKSINSINEHLLVQEFFYTVAQGTMDKIDSKNNLQNGLAFTKTETKIVSRSSTISNSVKYDLIGKLVDETGLTRKSIIAILKGLHEDVFNKFKTNPEEFILKTANLINDEKASAIIEHITYDALEKKYDTDIFTNEEIKGQLGVNAMEVKNHLFSHIVYDSSNEKTFAEKLDTDTQVAVYVKLPNSFYIPTPVGKYNPDWAIAFKEGTVKHIYFVAETKGSMQSMQLRKIEESKIHCAKEHFKAISKDNVVYDVVDSYDSLLNKVMR
jgi:type III restriction enzyme